MRFYIFFRVFKKLDFVYCFLYFHVFLLYLHFDSIVFFYWVRSENGRDKRQEEGVGHHFFGEFPNENVSLYFPWSFS